MEDKPTIIHEKIKCPLFHIHYDVIVGSDMEEMGDLVKEMHPGVELKLDVECTGYSCILTHPVHGSTLYIMIDTTERTGAPSILRRITHECTHMSWDILDAVGVKITVNNHEVQAYLMEELVDKVTELVNKFNNSESLK